MSLTTSVLEADYSAALTLLLRYPVPTNPYGPSTFVGDALYLRDNLLLDGGDHIISKYSRRAPETTVTRKLPKKIKRARTAEQTAAQKALLPEKASSPRLSPARILHSQGGIEGIIHEAAKGVYHQGERWGVAKALRGAVQGLQSGNISPRQLPQNSRWSLDKGQNVSDSPKGMMAKIQYLEERNRSLAKLLEKAMEDLWTQQGDADQKPNETTADVLSLAIAKVQFVQVYLENPTMPLPPEDISPKETKNDAAVETDAVSASPRSGAPPHHIQSDGATDENSDSQITQSVETMTAPVERSAPASAKPLPSTPRVGNLTRTSGLSPFSQARPALAQSSFSWMLGEDQQKSGFVSASPFSSERSNERRKGFQLFGDDKSEGRRNRQGSKSNGNGGDSDDDEDVFTMGTLKGGRLK